MKVIGTGSYGKVILSKKRDTGHIYAIKTLKKKHLIKKNQVEHTISERSILVSLRERIKCLTIMTNTLLCVGERSAPVYHRAGFRVPEQVQALLRPRVLPGR